MYSRCRKVGKIVAMGVLLGLIQMVTVFAAISVSDVPTLVSQADNLMESSKYRDALTAYKSLTTINKLDSNALSKSLYYIGKCHYRLKEYDNSKQILKRVKDEYPTSSYAANAKRLLGYVYLEEKDYLKALESFEDFVTNHPDSDWVTDAKERIAGIKHRLGNLTDAAELHDQVAQLTSADDSTRAEAQLFKAGLIFEKAKGEDNQYQVKGPEDRNRLLAESRDECKKVLDLSPNLKQKAIAELMIFESYYYQDDFDTVIKLGEQFFSLYGSSFTWSKDQDVLRHIGHGKFTLAYAKYRLGNLQGAIRDYQDLISLWPEHPACDRSQLEIGICYYNMKDYSNAAYAFQQLIQTYPQCKFVNQAQESLNTIQALFLNQKSLSKDQNINPTTNSRVAYNPGSLYSLLDVSMDNLCGPIALSYMMDEEGIASSPDEISRAAGLTPIGTNLAGLKNAAVRKGLDVTGIWIATRDILKIPTPAIIQLDKNINQHFVLLKEKSNMKVVIVDNGILQTQTNHEIQNEFTGYALVMDINKDNSIPSSAIRLSENQMLSVYGAGTTPPPPPPPDDHNPDPPPYKPRPRPTKKSASQSPSGNNGSGTDNQSGPGKALAFGSIIDLTNGQVYHEETLTAVSSRGLPIQVQWTHLSYARTTGAQPGPFGYGSNWSYGDLLIDNGTEILWKTGYSTISFKSTISGYLTPVGVTSKIIKNGNNTYTLTFKNNQKLEFNSSGRLIYQYDANGNQNRFTYTGNNITSIIDASSQTTFLYYDSSSRITTVKDPAGRRTDFIYSGSGNLLTQKNPLNEIITYDYDGYHRVTSIIEPNQLVRNYFYDSEGRCTTLRVFDKNNPGQSYIYKYGYDSLLKISWVVDPNGGTTYYFYNDTNWQTDRIQYANGINRYFTYDGEYNVLTDSLDGRITRYVWYGNRNMHYCINPSNDTVSYLYDSYNNLTTVTNSLGKSTTFYYQPNYSRLTAIQYPLGEKVFYNYDAYGQVISIFDSQGTIQSFAYNNRGNVIYEISPDNATTQFLYDIYGNCTTIIDPMGYRTDNQYDLLGRVTSVKNHLNGTTLYTYTTCGHIQSIKDEKNNMTQYFYNTFGRLTALKNAANHMNSYYYNNFGSLTSYRDANGNYTFYTYDALGRKISQKTGTGATIQLTYDSFGNLTDIQDPETGSITRRFDTLSRMTGETNPDGTLSYAYNKLGWRIALKDPDNNITSYYYDGQGRLAVMKNGFEQWTQFAFDSRNQKKDEIYPNGVMGNYTYSSDNQMIENMYYKPTDTFNRSNGTYIGSSWLENSGDWSINNNQLYIGQTTDVNVAIYNAGGYVSISNLEATMFLSGTGLYQNGYLVFGYTDSNNYFYAGYDHSEGQLKIGRKISGSYYTGASMNYPLVSDFALRFKVSVNYKTVYLSRLESKGYTVLLSNYYSGGIPTGKTGLMSSRAITGFDDFLLNQSTTVIARYSYQYDLNGNRKRMVDLSNNTTFYEYDSLQRLTTERRTGTNNYSRYYGYDAAGNRTSMVKDGITTNYYYNNLNQLIASTTNGVGTYYGYDNNGNQVQSGNNQYFWNNRNRLYQAAYPNYPGYAYDYFGKRIKRLLMEDQYITRYHYDEDRVIMEKYSENGGSYYDTLAVYTRIPDNSGSIISMRNSGTDYFYHADPSGNIQIITDINGNPHTTYVQDFFGNVINTAGNAPNSYHLNSQELDSNCALYYYDSRWYDGSTGNYLSRRTPDPARSAYHLSNNNQSLTYME